MKFKKLITSIFIMFAIISMHSQSSAKYVFECTEIAAVITIKN